MKTMGDLGGSQRIMLVGGVVLGLLGVGVAAKFLLRTPQRRFEDKYHTFRVPTFQMGLENMVLGTWAEVKDWYSADMGVAMDEVFRAHFHKNPSDLEKEEGGASPLREPFIESMPTGTVVYRSRRFSKCVESVDAALVVLFKNDAGFPLMKVLLGLLQAQNGLSSRRSDYQVVANKVVDILNMLKNFSAEDVKCSTRVLLGIKSCLSVHASAMFRIAGRLSVSVLVYFTTIETWLPLARTAIEKEIELAKGTSNPTNPLFYRSGPHFLNRILSLSEDIFFTARSASRLGHSLIYKEVLRKLNGSPRTVPDLLVSLGDFTSFHPVANATIVHGISIISAPSNVAVNMDYSQDSLEHTTPMFERYIGSKNTLKVSEFLNDYCQGDPRVEAVAPPTSLTLGYHFGVSSSPTFTDLNFSNWDELELQDKYLAWQEDPTVYLVRALSVWIFVVSSCDRALGNSGRESMEDLDNRLAKFLSEHHAADVESSREKMAVTVL